MMSIAWSLRAKMIAKLRFGSRRANDERKLEQHMWMV